MADQIVTGVDFAPIPTQDVNRAVQFYEDVLGMPRVVHHDHFAEFEPGDVTLNVYNPVTMGIAQEHTPNAHPLALHVEDVPSARAELESRGVEFMGDTFDTGVCHMGFFRDPDGDPRMLPPPSPPRTAQPHGNRSRMTDNLRVMGAVAANRRVRPLAVAFLGFNI